MKLLSGLFFGSFMLLSSAVCSQDFFSSGARNLSMAGASAGLSGCWSVYGNQAGLARISSTEIAGSFQNRFLINELSTRSGLVVFRVQSSVFAVSVLQFGKNPFHQEKFGLSFARQIFPKLNFGLQFNYYLLFLSEDNRNAGAAGLELGTQYLVTDHLVLGFHLLNPYQTGIHTRSGTYYYSSLINLGLNFHFSDQFSVAFELENDWSKYFKVRTGMEYCIFDQFFLRAGFSGKPYQFSGGMGFQAKKISIDLAVAYHEYLGSSPSVSLQYQF
jgi:hypothetical protein